MSIVSNLPREIKSKKETYHNEPQQTKPHNPSVLYQGPKPFSRSLELIPALVTFRTFHRINAIPNSVPFCTANAGVIVPFLIIFFCVLLPLAIHIPSSATDTIFDRHRKNPLGQVDKKVLSTPALDHHTTTTHFKTSSQTGFLHHDKKVRQGETLLIAELDPNITDRLSLASSNKPSPSSDMDATTAPHTRISIVIPNGRIWKSSSDLEAFYDEGYADRTGCWIPLWVYDLPPIPTTTYPIAWSSRFGYDLAEFCGTVVEGWLLVVYFIRRPYKLVFFFLLTYSKGKKCGCVVRIESGPDVSIDIIFCGLHIMGWCTCIDCTYCAE